LCGACVLKANFRDVLHGTIWGFDRAAARGVLVFDIGRMDMAISGERLLNL
jgi:hypothetical protein